MLHSDIVLELTPTTAPVQCDRCSACGTEFTYPADFEWVTFVLPGMLEMIEKWRMAQRKRPMNSKGPDYLPPPKEMSRPIDLACPASHSRIRSVNATDVPNGSTNGPQTDCVHSFRIL